MLKNIDPLLNADVLYALKSMGHGDELVIVDTNFPSESVARETVLGTVLRIDDSATRVAEALLSLMPLDSFVDTPVHSMQVVGDPSAVPPVVGEMQKVVDKLEPEAGKIGSHERFAFYEAAKKCFCLIQTQETRFYGNFIFKKGVIPPSD